MKTLTILAPTLNEEETISNFISAVLSQSEKISKLKISLLIVDSHSQDKTIEKIKECQKKHNNVHYISAKRGLGTALFTGYEYAFDKLKSDFVLSMEADLSNDPEQIVDFVSNHENFDLVIGSRYCKGGTILGWTWWRRFYSLGANLLMRLISGHSDVSEYTNLYRLISSRYWKLVRSEMSNQNGWLFVPALVFEGLSHKLPHKEVPIHYHDRLGGTSKMNTISYIKNLLSYLISFRLKRLWIIS